MSKGSVLVVEDDVLIRAVLAEALGDEGYEVVQAGNVLEAVAAIGRSAAFDALITDVDMPGNLSGLDLANMVATVSPGTQIIVTSGGELQARVDFRFLSKPYSFDGILGLLGCGTVEMSTVAELAR